MYKSLSKTCNGNFTLLAKIPSISFTFPNSPSPKLQSRFAPTLLPFAMPSPLPVTFWRCFAFSWKTTGPVVNFDGLPNGSSTLAANSITSLKNERTLAGQWTANGQGTLHSCLAAEQIFQRSDPYGADLASLIEAAFRQRKSPAESISTDLSDQPQSLA